MIKDWNTESTEKHREHWERKNIGIGLMRALRIHSMALVLLYPCSLCFSVISVFQS
jgi:hypothetical protein